MATKTKPAQQLAALMDRQRELAAVVHECEYRSRFASTEVADAMRAVEAAQRASGNCRRDCGQDARRIAARSCPPG